MGLFDTIREKAADLLGGVTENIGDLAGDLPGAEMLEGLSQSATDAVGQATDEAATTARDLSGSASDVVADAAGSVTDATDTVAGSLTDTPGQPPQP